MQSSRTQIDLPDATISISRRAFTSSREYNIKPRMFVDTGEFSLVEDLINRGRRPSTVWRNAVRDLFETFEIPIDVSEMRWSQRAGCGCGCSPGFILKHQYVTIDGFAASAFDVWVTLNDEIAVDESKPARIIEFV